MKKKNYCFILNLTFISLLLLSGCNKIFGKFNNLPDQQEENSITHEDEHEPPFIEYEYPNLSNYESSHQKEKLIYSGVRFEHADLSFAMSADTSGKRAKKARKENKPYFNDIDGIQRNEFINEPVIEENDNTLESLSKYSHQFKTLSKEANDVIDLAIRYCTVLDVLVYSDDFPDSFFLLSYDDSKDVINVFSKLFKNTYTIKLYYNHEGYETLEMTVLYPTNQAKYLLYTPGIQYKFAFGIFEPDYVMEMHIADKINNKWHSMSYTYSPINPYFSGVGFYDTANALPVINFGLGINNEFSYFTDSLNRLKQRKYGISSPTYLEEASEDDILVLESGSVSNEFIEAYNWNGELYCHYNINSSLFNNIVDVSYIDQMHAESVTLSNGLVIDNRDMWTSDYGYLKYDQNQKLFYDVDGNAIRTEDINCGLFQLVNIMNINGDCNNPNLQFEFAIIFSSVNSDVETIQNFKLFFDTVGLEYNNETLTSAFNQLERCITQKEEIKKTLINHFFDMEYNENTLLNLFQKQWQEFSNIAVIHHDYLTNYSRYAYFTLPRLEREPLISLSLDNKDITLLNGFISLENLSFSISPSILLKEDNNYTAVLYVGKKPIYNLFNIEKYNGSAMNFNGSSKDIDNESLFDKRGTFNIKLVFGLIEKNTNNFVPLSNSIELCVLSLSEFSFLTEEDTALGGYYKVTVQTCSNYFVVEKIFFDTQEPTISSSLFTVDGCFVMQETTLQDLINSLYIRDNIDYFISNENVNITSDNGFSSLDDFVISGIYTFTVSDSSGNVGTLVLNVTVIEGTGNEDSSHTEEDGSLNN